MNYKKIYEKQYGGSKRQPLKQNQFFGLRGLLKQYDLSRYDICANLIEPGERILDIGCGEGTFLRLVEDKFNQIYGVDISPSRLERAKEQRPSFKLIEGNADKSLPFEGDFFDALTCIATLEHVYDIFGLAEEMHRVLKPDGLLVVEVPNIAYLKRRLEFLFGQLPKTSSMSNWVRDGWDGGHIHYFNMKKFCWLFEQSGFIVKEKTGAGFLAPMRNWYPDLLCGDLIIKAIRK